MTTPVFTSARSMIERAKRSPVANAIIRVSELDLRALAVFRMLLGAIVLLQAAARFPMFGLLYTDAGIFPRARAVEAVDPWRWSLYFLAGPDIFGAVLLAATALAGIGMMLGYHTRMMTVAAWALVFSLQTRNPLVLSGADTLVRMLLFWGMALPLGGWWSLDARRSGQNRAPRFASVATAALVLQIGAVYLFTAILKTHPQWRGEATALHYALHARHLTTDAGNAVAEFHSLLQLMTPTTLALEYSIPLLLLVPVWIGPVRTAIVAAIVLFHLGIFVTMDLGFFPAASITAATALLPTWFWDRVLPRVTGWVSRLRPAVPGGGITSGPSHPEQQDVFTVTTARARAVQDIGPVASVAVTLALLLTMAWNIATVSSFTVPQTVRPAVLSLGLYQRWAMFAPRPAQNTIWYAYEAQLVDGTRLDVLPTLIRHNLDVVAGPPTTTPPADIPDDLYTSTYWRKYLDALAVDHRSAERSAAAAYLCRWWNGHYAEQLEIDEFTMVRLRQRTLPDGGHAPTEREVIAGYACG